MLTSAHSAFSHPISNPFTLIGLSWNFYRKHSVFNAVALWLLLFPMATTNVLMRLIKPASSSLLPSPYEGRIPLTTSTLPLIALVFLTLSIIMLWGSACTMLVGRRMVAHRAGRSRTSFHMVRREAARFIIPLLLTGILRSCFTFLWSLLLIVPGIIYAIRTAFYDLIIVVENIVYREALKRSTALILGHTWSIFWSLLFLSIILFLPINVLSIILEGFLLQFDPRLLLVIDIISGGLTSIATILFSLSTILLYNQLNQKSGEIYRT